MERLNTVKCLSKLLIVFSEIQCDAIISLIFTFTKRLKYNNLNFRKILFESIRHFCITQSKTQVLLTDKGQCQNITKVQMMGKSFNISHSSHHESIRVCSNLQRDSLKAPILNQVKCLTTTSIDYIKITLIREWSQKSPFSCNVKIIFMEIYYYLAGHNM